MIALPHLAEIERHLTILSPLADAVESRSMRLHGRVRDWIKDAEDLLRRHSMVQAGDLAVIRTELAAATRRGSVADTTGRSRSRRARAEQAAADALARAARVVEDAVAPARRLSEEGERIARQIASVARAKGYPSGGSDWGQVSAAWDLAARDPDLVSAATHLVGLVGRMNAIMLFMRAQSQL